MGSMLVCNVSDCIPQQLAFVVVNGQYICKEHWHALMKEGAELVFFSGETLKLPQVERISKEKSKIFVPYA